MAQYAVKRMNIALLNRILLSKAMFIQGPFQLHCDARAWNAEISLTNNKYQFGYSDTHSDTTHFAGANEQSDTHCILMLAPELLSFPYICVHITYYICVQVTYYVCVHVTYYIV